MTNQVIALLDGRGVGTVHYKNARLSFVYSDTWRADPNAYPLSLSMPLASAEHGHARIEAFLWGLLPDTSIPDVPGPAVEKIRAIDNLASDLGTPLELN
jgi:HipA-like protein